MCQDKLKNLRTYLLGKVCDMQGPKRLLAKATWPNPEPLFTASEVQDARKDFFSCLGVATDANTWKVREHQPLYLHALEALACFCGDPDVSLVSFFECLEKIELYCSKETTSKCCGEQNI